ncbi:MAG TPA: glycosyltransferase family 2 protein [Prolixibacteraceae bacterium]|nr:glycosyltransferase family 2 protein [Prolixibacteraceae bacterium]
MATITVLTASYNRSKTLGRLFQSLLNQTCNDFEWILINDGSTDNSFELINSFKTAKFQVNIYNQQNIGLNQTLNRGIELANGELIFRVDSDDYITDDAIEQIIKNKDKIMDDNKICALVFLTKLESGKIVGYHPFNSDFRTNFFDYYYKHNALGDRAEVVKRETYINYPFQKLGNEKFLPEVVMWAKMADKYDAIYINKPIYIREYSTDSISGSGTKANLNNPIGAMERYKTIITRTHSFKYQLIHSINYFRWAQKTNIQFFKIIQSAPIVSCLLGLIPGIIIHLIDKIDPILMSRLKHSIKNITFK